MIKSMASHGAPAAYFAASSERMETTVSASRYPVPSADDAFDVLIAAVSGQPECHRARGFGRLYLQ